MKRKLLMFVAGAFASLLLMALIVIWIVFSKLSTGYEMTDGKVYFRTFDNLNWKVDRREVVAADPSSFSQIDGSGGHYGRDATRVFFHEIEINGADPGSFRVLDWRRRSSRDENGVYWRSIRQTE